MKQIHIGVDEVRNQHEETYDAPLSITDLKDRIATMSVYADVEVRGKNRALVRVREDAGTSQFLATGLVERSWLQKFANRTERKAAVTLYHFKF